MVNAICFASRVNQLKSKFSLQSSTLLTWLDLKDLSVLERPETELVREYQSTVAWSVLQLGRNNFITLLFVYSKYLSSEITVK
jgi:hypothetical protein